MMMQINNNHSVELDVITSEFEREIRQKQAEMETLASEHVVLRETYEKTKVEQAAELEEIQATHRLTLQSIELQFNQVKCELAKRNDDKAQEELDRLHHELDSVNLELTTVKDSRRQQHDELSALLVQLDQIRLDNQLALVEQQGSHESAC